MARGINKVILVGNLGRDPEVRYMPSGGAVANAALATSESWRDKQSGEQQERTEWHNLVFYGRLAEIAGEYLKKGSKIYAEGKLQTRKWQDKNTGQDRYMTEIIVNEMQMLDSRGGAGDYGDSGSSSSGGFKRGGAAGGSSGGYDNRSAPPPQMDNMNDFDDDIPF